MRARWWFVIGVVAALGCGGGTAGPSGNGQIENLSPTSAVIGSGNVQLAVRGKGFGQETVVLWNGTPVPTTYVSPNALTAYLGDGQLRHPGTARVAVRDGPNGAASGSASFVVNNPVPRITGVSPSELRVGQGPVTLIVTGVGLLGYTKFRWNGTDRPAAFVDGNLTVDLDANDLASARQGQLVAVNPSPGGGVSPAAVVPVLAARSVTAQKAVQLQATTLLADRARQRVYAAVAAGDAQFPSSIAAIDAAAGTIIRTTPLSFEPNLLAASADGTVLYAASTVDSTVAVVDLTTGQVTRSFSVAGFAQYEPSAVGGLAEVPGEPGVVAVAIRSLAVTPDHEGYVVFDHGAPRPSRIGRALRANIIRPSDQPGELYGVAENGISALFRLKVTAAGIQVLEQVNLPGARGLDFAIESGHLISDAGTDVDLGARQIKTSLNLDRAAFAFDLTASRYYWMIAGVPTIRAYDLGSGLSVGPAAIGGIGSPRDGLVRWARDGFAIRTYTQVILFRTDQPNP